jgi:hypothetical protein
VNVGVRISWGDVSEPPVTVVVPAYHHEQLRADVLAAVAREAETCRSRWDRRAGPWPKPLACTRLEFGAPHVGYGQRQWCLVADVRLVDLLRWPLDEWVHLLECTERSVQRQQQVRAFVRDVVDDVLDVIDP